MKKITRVRIGKEQVNQSGHVGYLDLLILLDAAQDDFLRNNVRIHFDEVESRWRLLLVVKTVHIEYSIEGTGYLREGDELSVSTDVESVDDMSFTFAQTTTRGKDLICTSTLTVALDDQEGKPARIPNELHKLLTSSA